MIKHIVAWKLQDTAQGFSKAENMQRIKQELEGLVDKIDDIKHLEVGLNFNTSDAAYDLILSSEFESRKTFDMYQKHPEHVRVAKFVNDVKLKRVVVDYEI